MYTNIMAWESEESVDIRLITASHGWFETEELWCNNQTMTSPWVENWWLSSLIRLWWGIAVLSHVMPFRNTFTSCDCDCTRRCGCSPYQSWCDHIAHALASVSCVCLLCLALRSTVSVTWRFEASNTSWTQKKLWPFKSLPLVVPAYSYHKCT